jgi:hypothetical protein
MTEEELNKLNEEFIKHYDYKADEDNDDEDNDEIYECDYCDEIDEMGYTCKHAYSCEDCQFDVTKNYNVHYAFCIYCILDGNDWDEEWDSWYEVASRGHNVLLNGMMDVFKHGKGYKFNKTTPSHSQVASFQTIYQRGVNIASSIRYDKDDNKIMDTIKKSMNRHAKQ